MWHRLPACEFHNVWIHRQDACATLLDDLERGPLPVARRGAGQQRANRLNRLAVAPDDPADVGLAKLHPKDRCLPRWNFGKHHLIGKLDELANDEFEELFHEVECIHSSRFVTLVDRALRRSMGYRLATAASYRAIPPARDSIHLVVRRLEVLGIFADRPDFFAVRPEQPEPIVRATADEIPMLLNQQAIFVFA